MEVEGELCVLLWQPAVGPWEAIRAYPSQGSDTVEAAAVWLAIRATNCFFDCEDLEKDAQIQLQQLVPGAEQVWTVDIGRDSNLQPQDKSLWVWTPVYCVRDPENALY